MSFFRDVYGFNKTEKIKHMNEMRGIFALEVLLGHVFRWENCIWTPLGKFMICSVAFFFFVSGFTMTESAINKKGYLSCRFLKNKIGYLLLISVAVYYVNRLIDYLSPYDLGYSTRSFFSIYEFFWKTNWFIWELMAFYIIFFLVYKYVPKKYRIIVVFLVTLIGCILLHMRGLFYNWVASAFGFPLGCLFNEYYDKCSKILCSIKGMIIIAGFTVLGVFSLIIPDNNFLTCVILRNCICVAAIFIILFICEWAFLRNNPVSKFLTKYSGEIYMIQFVWMNMSENFPGWNYYMRMVFVLIVVPLSAMIIIYPVGKLVKKVIE